MKPFLDCIPCMLRQVLDAACMATEDESMQQRIMDEALRLVSNHRQYRCGPEMCQEVHAIVKRQAGVADPYASIKSRDIAQILALEPLIRQFASLGDDQLQNTLKVAATGNVMDAALFQNLDMEACLKDELEKPFYVCHQAELAEDLARAKRVLIIGDNAGEAVFDKILAEHLAKDHQVFYAVREEPIINDVTDADAAEAGLDDCAQVISTGCGMPGAYLDSCSQEFRNLYDRADVVISKGQGNLEALYETHRRVYFLLKTKCPKLARTIGLPVNAYILMKNK